MLVKQIDRTAAFLKTMDALDSVIVDTRKVETFLLITARIRNLVLFSCETNLKLLVATEKVCVGATLSY